MKYVLIKARHVHPEINELPAIFEDVHSNQIFDFDWHKKIIHASLQNKQGLLILYVTGLTPLLVSVLNYCKLFNITVKLYHYDNSINKYVAQSVL